MNSLNKNRFNPVEKNLPILTIPDLKKYSTSHLIKKGQNIFYQGHIPYGIYILKTGEIALITDNSKKVIKSPYTIEINNFLNNLPYQCTAKAIQDSEVYFISKSGFQKLLHNYGPLLCQNFKAI